MNEAERDASEKLLGREPIGYATVWHEGSQSFYRAALLARLTPQEVEDENDPETYWGKQMSTKSYRDMSADEMLAWGAAESAARIADLNDRTPEGLKRALANAEQRRKMIGASSSQAAALVIDANRAARRAAA